MYKCPHCNKEITLLNYKEDAIIYGTIAIETEDYEQDDTETIGGLIFTCPECEEEIDSLEDLIIDDEEEEMPRPNTGTIKEEEKELPVPQAIDDKWKNEYSGFHNSNDIPRPSEILICPQCGNKNEAKIDENIECYNCNKRFNRITAKKIIPLDN